MKHKKIVKRILGYLKDKIHGNSLLLKALPRQPLPLKAYCEFVMQAGL
jgi:hypothetical protein